RRLDDRERWPCGADSDDERRDRLEMIDRERIVRNDVVIAGFRDAELAKVPADARLCRVEAVLTQHLHQFVLIAHGRFAQDAQNRGTSRDGLVDFGGHGKWAYA